jgi:hypothetical protein
MDGRTAKVVNMGWVNVQRAQMKKARASEIL